MKYTVLGFHQGHAVALGLGLDELMILRWFVDFQGTGRMVRHSMEDGDYLWVDYKSVLRDIPVIGVNKDGIARKFKKLVDAGVLKRKTMRRGGVFSLYAFDSGYEALISQEMENGPSVKNDEPSVKNADCPSKMTEPSVKNDGTHPSKMTEQKILLLKDQSTKDQEREKRDAPTQETLLEERGFSSAVKERILEWMQYKTERREKYTQTGLKSFLTLLEHKLEQYREEDVLDLIAECMANGWRGVIWARLSGKEKKGPPDAGGPAPEITPETDRHVRLIQPDEPFDVWGLVPE